MILWVALRIETKCNPKKLIVNADYVNFGNYLSRGNIKHYANFENYLLWGDVGKVST